MPTRPLLVTADASLLDEMLRLCAAAGVEADVAHDAASARLAWTAPPLVVLGQDVAPEVAAARLPRRPGVVLTGLGLDVAASWDLANALGAETVVPVPAGQGWLIERLAAADDTLAGDGTVVAVVGGRGGSGATTLAAALARTAADDGVRCLLVDADPLGGGIDLVLGAESADGLRWPDLTAAHGRVDGAALLDALPRVRELSVLSAGRGEPATVPAEVMQSVLAATTRACDLVVVDVPRHLDPTAEHALVRADVTLLVVPAEVRAVAAAAGTASVVAALAADLRLVVRGPSPAGLSAQDVAAALALPLAGWLAAEPRLQQALERGEPPGRGARSPLTAFCKTVLADLGLAGRSAA